VENCVYHSKFEERVVKGSELSGEASEVDEGALCGLDKIVELSVPMLLEVSSEIAQIPNALRSGYI
jgi:hypothetical protein